VTFSQQASPELTLAISSLTGSNSLDPLWVVSGDIRYESRPVVDVGVAPSDSAQVVPGGYQRGSALDLFLCLLLGMTPLFYTPEALILLWIGYNARSRRSPRQPLPTSARLWGVYAFVVAVFWLITLEGMARFAALGPIAVGILQLMSEPERERGPVRVDFRRKKKEAQKKDASKKEAPSRSSDETKTGPASKANVPPKS
jgi:hypothetical protein